MLLISNYIFHYYQSYFVCACFLFSTFLAPWQNLPFSIEVKKNLENFWIYHVRNSAFLYKREVKYKAKYSCLISENIWLNVRDACWLHLRNSGNYWNIRKMLFFPLLVVQPAWPDLIVWEQKMPQNSKPVPKVNLLFFHCPDSSSVFPS